MQPGPEAGGPAAPADATPWEEPFPPEATAADILACFRLLLGRRPNREEWPGHLSRAGEPLERVVGTYVGSLEFARRGLGAASGEGDGSGAGIELARLPGFSIHLAADDAAVGRFVRENNYEHDVSAVFRRLLRPGMGVLDLGANIGYFALLSASVVGPDGLVVAVEPNPANARLLEASRRRNGFEQLRVVQVAAGRNAGTLVLHRDFSNGTTSAAPHDPAAILRSETVGCVRADTLVPAGRRIDLIKVDVEGAEYLALGGCERIIRRWRPAIVSEFSPSLMPGISGISGPEYLRWLGSLGYGLGIIMPDGTVRDADPDAIMAEHARRGTDHLDLLLTPRRPFGFAGGWLRRRLQRRSIASR